jgi:hypothetical protein
MWDSTGLVYILEGRLVIIDIGCKCLKIGYTEDKESITHTFHENPPEKRPLRTRSHG